MTNPRPIRIALPDPKKERKLSGPFQDAMNAIGFIISPTQDSNAIFDVRDERAQLPDFQLVYKRTGAMTELMARGAIDIAVLGRNVIDEFNYRARQNKAQPAAIAVQDLGFSECRLVIAVPSQRAGEVKKAADLLELREDGTDKLRIATSYPATVKNWLAQENVDLEKVDLVVLPGGVEEAIELEAADIVCDITQTGNSLRENNLVEKFQIGPASEAIVAARTGDWEERGLDYNTALKISERLREACIMLGKQTTAPTQAAESPERQGATVPAFAAA